MAEKEYIERYAALKIIDKFSGYLDDDMIWRIKFALKNHIPAVDAVEVVRCMDCINFEQGFIGWCNEFECGIYCDDFCSHGIRKGNGNV